MEDCRRRVEKREEIIAAMLRWSEDFIEQPHSVVGDLPVCPFAKAARLKKAIRFEVMPFDLTDPLEPCGDLLSLVGELPRDPEIETLFVIHPEPARIGARALEAFVARLNARLAVEDATSDLEAFEAHPDSEFCIGGVYTRRGPYPSFQVLSRRLLKAASDSLLGSRYYDRFTSDMLRAVGMPRDEVAQEGGSNGLDTGVTLATGTSAVAEGGTLLNAFDDARPPRSATATSAAPRKDLQGTEGFTDLWRNR